MLCLVRSDPLDNINFFFFWLKQYVKAFALNYRPNKFRGNMETECGAELLRAQLLRRVLPFIHVERVCYSMATYFYTHILVNTQRHWRQRTYQIDKVHFIPTTIWSML